MSITSPDLRISTYAPVVPTTAFEAQFPVFDNSDIGATVAGVDRTDFTVTASYALGISTDAVVNFAAGVTGDVKIYGKRASRRSNRFSNGAPLPIFAQNLALDTLEAEMQEVRRDADRSLKMPLSAPLPLALSPQANTVLGWVDGILVNVDPTLLVNMAGYASASQGQKADTALQIQSLVKFGGLTTVSDNTIALAAAKLSGDPIYISEGLFQTLQTTDALPIRMYGPGQVKDASGRRGRNFSWRKQAPASLGTPGSVTNGFDGDLSAVQNVHEYRITGNALGAPTTGYLQVPETAMEILNVFVQSGHNEALTAGGRTGFAAKDNRLGHYGAGDAFLYFLSVSSAGAAKVGAVDFLANPAVGFINGSLVAQADGAYLNTIEWNHYDSGFRAAVVPVINFFRTVDSELLQEVWMGLRLNSQGPAAADNALSVQGYWKTGLDTTAALLGTREAAIAIAGGQRLYMNGVASNVVAWARSLGTEWLEWDTALSQMKAVVGGSTAVSFSAPPSAVNSLVISANVSAGVPYIGAQGPASNIGLRLAPKGGAQLSIPLGNVPNFASDALAGSGGLIQGDIYRTGQALQIKA